MATARLHVLFINDRVRSLGDPPLKKYKNGAVQMKTGDSKSSEDMPKEVVYKS